jgi:hypothetical protein
MNGNHVFSNIFETIVDETCLCLESDRASLFIYDNETS